MDPAYGYRDRCVPEDDSYVECRRCTPARNLKGQQEFEKLGMADLDTILPHIDTTFDVVHTKAPRDFEFLGVMLRLNTTRLMAHKLNGCRCAKCGLDAEFFAVERVPGSPSWHLNLYSSEGLLFHAALKDEFPSDAPNAIKADPKNFDTLCHGCFTPRKNEHGHA
jgi:hypothetical protein